MPICSADFSWWQREQQVSGKAWSLRMGLETGSSGTQGAPGPASAAQRWQLPAPQNHSSGELPLKKNKNKTSSQGGSLAAQDDLSVLQLPPSPEDNKSRCCAGFHGWV